MDNENWYDNLNKSPLNPPNYVFGIVWPLLYILMFISFGIVIYNNRTDKIRFFIIQFILNLLWTTIFFKYKSIVLAFIMLILIIFFTILTIIDFYSVNNISALLLIPYILWLSFASYLNFYIIIYN